MGYRTYALQSDSDTNFAIAQVLERHEEMLAANYVRDALSDSKKLHARALEIGAPIDPYNEEQSRLSAELRAEEFLKKREERAQLLRARDRARDSLEKRDFWLWTLIASPIVTAALIVAGLWVARGFSRNSNSPPESP
jgi:hypothetical protein